MKEKLKVKSSQKNNSMEKKIGYTEAMNELERIVTEIEEGEITVDTLSVKVKRASELIKICREKLTATESDVSKILEEIKGD